MVNPLINFHNYYACVKGLKNPSRDFEKEQTRIIYFQMESISSSTSKTITNQYTNIFLSFPFWHLQLVINFCFSDKIIILRWV